MKPKYRPLYKLIISLPRILMLLASPPSEDLRQPLRHRPAFVCYVKLHTTQDSVHILRRPVNGTSIMESNQREGSTAKRRLQACDRCWKRKQKVRCQNRCCKRTHTHNQSVISHCQHVELAGKQTFHVTLEKSQLDEQWMRETPCPMLLCPSRLLRQVPYYY